MIRSLTIMIWLVAALKNTLRENPDDPGPIVKLGQKPAFLPKVAIRGLTIIVLKLSFITSYDVSDKDW